MEEPFIFGSGLDGTAMTQQRGASVSQLSEIPFLPCFAVFDAEAIICNVLLPHRIAVSIFVAEAHGLIMRALGATIFDTFVSFGSTGRFDEDVHCAK